MSETTESADGRDRGAVYLCGPVEQSDDPHTWRESLKEQYPDVEFIDPMDFQEDWDEDPTAVIEKELRVCERHPILACNLGSEGPKTVGSHHEIAHALANGNDRIAAVCEGEPAGFTEHRPVTVYDDVDAALSALLAEADGAAAAGTERAHSTDPDATDGETA